MGSAAWAFSLILLEIIGFVVLLEFFVWVTSDSSFVSSDVRGLFVGCH